MKKWIFSHILPCQQLKGFHCLTSSILIVRQVVNSIILVNVTGNISVNQSKTLMCSILNCKLINFTVNSFAVFA